jgi:hypothetical protein
VAAWHTLNEFLEAVIALPEPVLVRFFRSFGLLLSILFLEACLIPTLPGGQRVVWGSEGFLFTNSGDPFIDRRLVGLL